MVHNAIIPSSWTSSVVHIVIMPSSSVVHTAIIPSSSVVHTVIIPSSSVVHVVSMLSSWTSSVVLSVIIPSCSVVLIVNSPSSSAVLSKITLKVYEEIIYSGNYTIFSSRLIINHTKIMTTYKYSS